MIIKNLTRKSGSGQLLTYICRYMQQDKKEERVPFILRHNIRSTDIPGFVKEFKANAKNRTHTRKDQVAIHHTILSWSNKDREQITPEKIKSVANRFVTLRGENNLYIGTIHTDKDHIHLHIAMSGSQLNGQASRISKAEFAELKLSLDNYQREQFPELENSLPDHGRKQELKLKAVREQAKPDCLKALENAASPLHIKAIETTDKSLEEIELENLANLRNGISRDRDLELSL
jgi:hypothetical protein